MQQRQDAFDRSVNDSRSVLEEANETMELVKKWDDRSSNLTDRFAGILSTLEQTSSRLNDLLENAESALNKSETTDELLQKVKDMISELQDSTKTIKTKKEEIERTLEEATQNASMAEDFVNNATSAYMVSRNSVINSI